MIETLALRFRDLSGPTIDGHRQLISQHGHVWWGWWSKPGERVPRDLFARFLDEIREDRGLVWFLADSGERRLYRATVTDIVYSDSSQRIASPDKKSTPPYYGDQEYLAWFCLSAIDDAEETDLTAHSYEEPSAGSFDDDPHREAFDGKCVFSLDEMLSRHRTIYFLRERREGDPSHLASLEPSLRVTAFMTETREVPSSYIVQLSDLHFGSKHAYRRASDEIHRNLALRVSDDLTQEYGGSPPAAVILSGDFTWQGTTDEFQWAREFVDHLQSVFKIHPSRFVMCPGNHDIQWSPSGADYDPATPVTAASEAAQANYRSFVNETIQLTPGESLALGRRYLLSNFVPVEILALDSSRLEQQHFAGYGFVSRQQFNDAAGALNWTPSNKGGQYRVVVLHHHMVPVIPVEAITNADVRYSLTLDAGELLYRALELGVDLIVHGHMHQPFTALYGRAGSDIGFSPSRRVVIQAAGSVGVESEYLPAGVGRNSYLIYEFSPEQVTVRRRASSPDVDGFADAGSHTFTRTEWGLK